MHTYAKWNITTLQMEIASKTMNPKYFARLPDNKLVSYKFIENVVAPFIALLLTSLKLKLWIVLIIVILVDFEARMTQKSILQGTLKTNFGMKIDYFFSQGVKKRNGKLFGIKAF